MAELKIERGHALGLAAAREVASEWLAQARDQYGMACEHEVGEAGDRIRFSRPGVSGEVRVTGDRFEMDAKLGFLLGAYKDRIAAEIGKNLDALLRQG